MTKKPPIPPKEPPAALTGGRRRENAPKPRLALVSAAPKSGKIGHGIYADVPIAKYHGDLCPGPSMSASNAIDVMTLNPWLAWHRSYLCPERIADDSKNALLGTAAHALLLEGEAGYYRTAAVQPYFQRTSQGDFMRRAWEKETARRGELVILSKAEDALVRALVDVVKRDAYLWPLINGGQHEQTIVWRDEESGLWCKARPDVINAARGYALDYKGVPSVHPDAFEVQAFRMGFHMQAAWGLEALAKTSADPTTRDAMLGLRWIFAAQERRAPYPCEALHYTAHAIARGHELNRRARVIWARCLARNEWPGYRAAGAMDRKQSIEIDIPRWADWQFEERSEAPRLASDIPSRALLARMMEAQAPLDGEKDE